MKLRSGKTIKRVVVTTATSTQPVQEQTQVRVQVYCEACEAGQLSQWAHTCVFAGVDPLQLLDSSQDYEVKDN